MKQLFTLIVFALICPAIKAQTDSIPGKMDSIPKLDTLFSTKADTIRIGKIAIIIHDKKSKKETEVIMGRNTKKKDRPSNLRTNWFVVDLGFSNYSDKTDYAVAGNYLVNKPGEAMLGKGDLKLNTSKSINVNIWVFMQRLNLVKHYLNLKYGIGLELNNYRYKSSISYKQGGPVPYSDPAASVSDPFIFRDSISFSKNKLAADYISIPFLLNFASNPGNLNKGISASIGVSAGYLYSQRNKQKSGARGKQRNKGEYGLEQFKLSYIGEIGLGPVRLYGSYSPSSMYEKGLDIRPYTLGLRFSNW